MDFISTDDLVTLSQLKTSIGIDGDMHDDRLLGIIHEASQEVLSACRPHLSDTDKLEDTHLFAPVSQTALLRARASWYEWNDQLDRARYNDERYEKKLESLIELLKSERPGRSKTTIAVSADPVDRTYLPTERDIYIAREFI